MSAQTPSSSTEGFFQPLPDILPLFTFAENKSSSEVETSDDAILPRILDIYLPRDEHEIRRTIHKLARRALNPEVLAHTVDAESNQPVLKPFDTFGRENKTDPLWTTNGWKALKAIGQEEGTVSTAYDSDTAARYNRRIHQFGLGHVWSCTATMTNCPASMTDGAAKLLAAHLDDSDIDQPGFNEVVREAFRRLTSRDPSEAWTTGQWMTERAGGSDVSGTETVARRLSSEDLDLYAKEGYINDAHGLPLGPWRIDGFKWFSSATDSDMALMLAQTSKGLSLFLAPMRRAVNNKPSSELNGIRIQRLKNKIGTKSLPTAELELKGTRGWLIGQEGKGVKVISTILNLTRLHTAAGCAGSWARGLQICRAYSRVRKVRGGLLQDNQQHLRWMASNTVGYTAAVHFSFFGDAMLGALEQGYQVVKLTKAAGLIPENPDTLATLFRLLTPVMKSQISIGACHALREHMECLGGVGYCENHEDGGILNISKILRDNLVSPIWEGTVSVMAEDVVRVMTDKRIAQGKVLRNTYRPWVEWVQSSYREIFPREAAAVEARLEALLTLEDTCMQPELLFRGRELLVHLEVITCAVLLLFDATVDQDEVAVEVSRRWIESKISIDSTSLRPPTPWKEVSSLDKKIFLGRDERRGSLLGKL